MLKVSKLKKIKPIICSDSCGCSIDTDIKKKELNTSSDIIDIDKKIEKVQEALDNVRQVKKCRACECFLDVLTSINTDLEVIKTPQAKATQKVMKSWFDEGNKERHSCLGCEECLPIKPYNYFNALLNGVQGDKAILTEIEGSKPCDSGDCCMPPKSSRLKIADKWPIVEGNYMVGNTKATVAVCTLSDVDLPNELKEAGALENTSIIGTLATENLGIERIIRNLVSNPTIEFLILCGKESRGHKAGQAIVSLKDNGLDRDKRIIGAMGPRPILKNITYEEIEAFGKNVTVIDEIGTKDVSRLMEVLKMCKYKSKGEKPTLPPKVNTPKVIDVQHLSNREWVHDPEGFFVIFLIRDDKKIVCECYAKESILEEVIKGVSAEDIANTVIKRGLISRLDHAAYLGRELAKAEMSIKLGVKYVQDKA
ncbi:tetrahydromethanopterin S-methyltransferase subunit A [Clostridium sp.]|uniref:tetrahydromethanopterin S-methyltransferase subunit A n=1 Tax=Clostridium sp. TaxID=1506 RepID=UPI00262E5470|nr:tetrahydromethanopterin S-methyltransferase subunit A [uncultured Clostridium sp.]